MSPQDAQKTPFRAGSDYFDLVKRLRCLRFLLRPPKRISLFFLRIVTEQIVAADAEQAAQARQFIRFRQRRTRLPLGYSLPRHTQPICKFFLRQPLLTTGLRNFFTDRHTKHLLY